MTLGTDKKILVIIIAVLVILSIAFVSLRFEVKNITHNEDDKPSILIKILSDSNSGTAPLSVTFKSLVLYEQGVPQYTWDFGDGTTSNDKSPTHVYMQEGVFSCKLMVKDENAEKTDLFNITVFQNNPPDVKIILSKNTAFRPETITFDARVFDPEGDELQYDWNLRYPAFFGYEKVETHTEKNFTKNFLRNGNYVAELTVTDEAGNSVFQFARINMQKSQPELFYNQVRASLFFLPTTVAFVWQILKTRGGDEKITDWLDENWLDWPDKVQNMVLSIIEFLGVPYEPPIHNANLKLSEVSDINHSLTVNLSGGVQLESSKSSLAIIENEDNLTAKNMYITLYNPLTEEEGIDQPIEKNELEISIDIGSISKKLFYNGKYADFTDCYFIQNLATGDKFTGEITVNLNEADSGTFQKGVYPCNIYLYQEKADYVDVIPFKIIL